MNRWQSYPARRPVKGSSSTRRNRRSGAPPLYRVVLLNDDYTPMDFVVHVLESFFSMPRDKATQVMLQVHTRGKGVCGVYTREIAETKAHQVNAFSRENQHPLLCTIEPA